MVSASRPPCCGRDARWCLCHGETRAHILISRISSTQQAEMQGQVIRLRPCTRHQANRKAGCTTCSTAASAATTGRNDHLGLQVRQKADHYRGTLHVTAGAPQARQQRTGPSPQPPAPAKQHSQRSNKRGAAQHIQRTTARGAKSSTRHSKGLLAPSSRAYTPQPHTRTHTQRARPVLRVALPS